MQRVGRYLHDSFAGDKGVSQLETFWWCDSLHAGRNGRMKSQRFVDACVEILQLRQGGGCGLFILDKILIQLFLKFLKD
jgi:hypothetical protein